MVDLPDRMTGKDLVVQEEHEANFERQLFNGMDKVDRRDKRNQIVSSTATPQYRDGWERIWGKKQTQEAK